MIHFIERLRNAIDIIFITPRKTDFIVSRRLEGFQMISEMRRWCSDRSLMAVAIKT